jgi:hypothetical protein
MMSENLRILGVGAAELPTVRGGGLGALGFARDESEVSNRGGARTPEVQFQGWISSMQRCSTYKLQHFE